MSNITTKNTTLLKLNLSDSANVQEAFDITRSSSCVQMTAWQTVTGSISESYQNVLEDARLDLIPNHREWNEEEIKMEFVSLVMRAAKINEPQKIKVFYERPLKRVINGYDISVQCDCSVATPTVGGRPAQPYFFFKEFKRTKGDSLDPEAQMLAAMVAAQDINADDKPIYGAYQQGIFWTFCILTHKLYCTGKTFNATETSDLHQIVYMLQHLKTMILERI